MITQKPQEIDFIKLAEIMDKQSKNMVRIMVRLKEDILELGNKENLSSDEKKMLEIYKFDLEDKKIAYQVKANAYQRYLVRANEQELRDQAELKDYVDNGQQILQKAISYSKHFKLPNNLKNHLKEVLQQNIMFQKNIPLKPRVDYYLALKKEVEICNNYLK